VPTALALVVLAQLEPTDGMMDVAIAFQFAPHVPYSTEKGGASELSFPQLCHLASSWDGVQRCWVSFSHDVHALWRGIFFAFLLACGAWVGWGARGVRGLRGARETWGRRPVGGGGSRLKYVQVGCEAIYRRKQQTVQT